MNAVLSAAACLGIFFAEHVWAQSPQPLAHVQPPAALDAPAGIIREIEFSGIRRIPATTLRGHVRSRVGDAPDPARIESDVRALHALGWLESVRVTIEPLPLLIAEAHSAEAILSDAPVVLPSNHALRLTFLVEERPFLAGVEFRGSRLLRAERIQALLEEKGITLRVARPADSTVLWRAARAIEQELARLGHARARAALRLMEQRGDSVRAMFEISDGPRVEVARVGFRGNHVFPEKTLRGRMKEIAPGAWLAAVRGKTQFDAERLASDIGRLGEFYRSRGYADATFGEPQLVETDQRPRRRFPWLVRSDTRRSDTRRLEITVPVAEGLRYSLDSVNVEGARAEHSVAVGKVIAGFRPGETYAPDKLEHARSALAALTWPVERPAAAEIPIPSMRGKQPVALRGDVELIRRFDPSSGTVRATLVLREPAVHVVRRIQFRGHHRFGEAYYRRRILLREGDFLDARSLQRGLQQLARDGLVRPFTPGDVEVSLDHEAGVADVSVRVQEIGRQRISFTGGAAAAGSTLGLAYQVFNLFGGEELLTTRLDAGPEILNTAFGLAREGLFAGRISLGLNLFHTYIRPRLGAGSSSQLLFTTRSTGLRAEAGYSATSADTVGFRYDLVRSRTQLHSGLPGQLAGLDGSNVILRRIRSTAAISWERATRAGGNAQITPQPAAKSAQRVVAAAALSGTGLGGQEDSLRATLEAIRLERDPFSAGRNTWAARSMLSGIGSSTGRTLPRDARMFSGEELVRGFRAGELGAFEDTAAGMAAPGQPTPRAAGASLVAAFNLEYRMPLAPAASWIGETQAAAFLDTGAGWLLPRWLGGSKPSLLEGSNGIWRASTGLEIRFTIPGVGQTVRVYAAWSPLRLAKSLLLGDGEAFQRPSRRFGLGWALGTLF